MCFLRVRVNDWVDFFLMYLLRKKPKHFVRYFYSSALPVQLNMYGDCFTVCFFLLANSLVVELNCTGWTTTALKGQMLEGLKFFFYNRLHTKKTCFVEMHDIGCRI